MEREESVVRDKPSKMRSARIAGVPIEKSAGGAVLSPDVKNVIQGTYLRIDIASSLMEKLPTTNA